MRINITIPVFNEEKILNKNIRKLFLFCQGNIQSNFKIVIVNNGSTDNTENVAEKICKDNKKIEYLFTKEKGRGNAIKTSWLKKDADIYSYMDVDLSTNLKTFPKMISEIKKGYDIVIGSRLLKDSKVRRCIHRTILSKTYNFLVQKVLHTKIKDLQCGLKVVNKKVVKSLLKKTKDGKWFFDTELLLLAEKEGYKIKEFPVEWIGNPNTKVKIIKTIIDYVTNSIKLRQRIKNENKY